MFNIKRLVFSLFFISLWPQIGSAIQLTQVATGFTSPVFVTKDGSNSSLLYVVEQGGLIKIISNGQVLSQSFLDVSSKIINNGERGLFSLAFHPKYSSNGLFFILYTDTNGDVTLARYARSSVDPLVADSSSAKIILRASHRDFSNHNGGHVAFGPDGFLYVSIGDGGGSGDPLRNGQRLTTFLGKILRIDVTDTSTYKVPSSNPFVGRKGVKKEIWAYGLRNPWRYSFDRTTKRLFLADVGQNKYEEVNLITAGRNYGWNIREGLHCFKPATGCQSTGLTRPIAEYSHSEGESITGGYVYRGSAIPSLKGRYIFGDFISGKVFSIKEDKSHHWNRSTLLSTGRLVSSFGLDNSNELLVVDYQGTIFKLAP